jgi:NarL family two-component system response regulator YdfI
VTRVLVASASATRRLALEAVIEANRSLELVGSSVSLADLPQEVEELEPDVVVVQTGQRDDRTIGELRAISRGDDEFRAPALVVLTDTHQIPDLVNAIRSGIRALLPLDATASEIARAIEAAAAGLFVTHPDFAELLQPIHPVSDPPGSDAPAEISKPPLTPREIEVLNLMAQGLGNKEIAWRLGISEHTVKFHVGSIFNKLDASGRTEAVTLGIRAGLILL